MNDKNQKAYNSGKLKITLWSVESKGLRRLFMLLRFESMRTIVCYESILLKKLKVSKKVVVN